MADAVKPVRQRVQEKAPDEFVGCERHHLVLVVVPVIAPAETDTLAGERVEPAVGDGDPMRVAPKIGQHGRRTGKGPLAIDDPLDPSQIGEAFVEARRAASRGGCRRTPACRRRRRTAACRETAGGTGVTALAPTGRSPAGRRPSVSRLRRQAAARDEAMDMWMVLEVLTPRMEHGDKADLGAEMAPVGGDRAAASRPPP